MNKYEAMFIIRPDLSEEDKENLFTQIKDTITKNNGNILNADIWAEKRKLYFAIKRCREGIYYLVNFTASPQAISQIRHAYKLNENILRVLITRVER
ncbi:MAG: 30S ribosomal protein S6 [Candidatus Omnitrophica bacterium]|nr:30S ribosomal protein S6 [Candidatus Omnitrophota bacterium]MBI5145033.1 30S ribosomal protein S6 [Candidatus Omnitrophota bacterium]